MPTAQEYRDKIDHIYQSAKEQADDEAKRVTLMRAIDNIEHYQAQYIAEHDNFTRFPDEDYRLFVKCYIRLADVQRKNMIYEHSPELKKNLELAIEYLLSIMEPIDHDYRLLGCRYNDLFFATNSYNVNYCRNAINATMLVPENQRTSQDQNNLGTFWYNLAHSYCFAHENHKAISSALRSLEFPRELNHSHAYEFEILSLCYARIGDINNAMQYFYLMMQDINNKPDGILNNKFGRDWFGRVVSLADSLRDRFYPDAIEYHLFTFIRKVFLGKASTFPAFDKLYYSLMTSHYANQPSILFSILEQVMMTMRDIRSSSEAPVPVKLYFSKAENLASFEAKLEALSNRNKEAMKLEAIVQSSPSFNIGVAMELTHLKKQGEDLRAQLAEVKNELQSQRRENVRLRRYVDGEARRSSLRSGSLFQDKTKQQLAHKRTGEEVGVKSRVSKRNG